VALEKREQCYVGETVSDIQVCCGAILHCESEG
jgi:hypothetical protein